MLFTLSYCTLIQEPSRRYLPTVAKYQKQGEPILNWFRIYLQILLKDYSSGECWWGALSPGNLHNDSARLPPLLRQQRLVEDPVDPASSLGGVGAAKGGPNMFLILLQVQIFHVNFESTHASTLGQHRRQRVNLCLQTRNTHQRVNLHIRK